MKAIATSVYLFVMMLFGVLAISAVLDVIQALGGR
jgi:hypothetical protein